VLQRAIYWRIIRKTASSLPSIDLNEARVEIRRSAASLTRDLVIAFVRQASSVGLRGLRRLQIPGSLKKRRSTDFDFAKTAGWLQVRGLIAGAFLPNALAVQELPLRNEARRLSKKS
jgi:hypothetical protein